MKKSRYAWAVVRVWRGLPEGVELFAQEESARKRERQLRRRLAQEDEIGVFHVRMTEELGSERITGISHLNSVAGQQRKQGKTS